MPTDYKLAKIYKIECYQTEKIYIGATCKKYLSTRMVQHRSDYKRWKEGKKRYITSFEILHYDNAFITLIENYPCNSKAELHSREAYHIQKENCVNKFVPGRNNNDSVRAYYQKNKIKIDEKKKKYRKNNATFREYLRQWHKYYYIGKKIDSMMEDVNKINNDIRIKLNTVV